MTMDPLTRLAGLFSLLLVLGGVTGCNTIEGAGQDIERAGEMIEQSAEDVQN